MTLPCDICFEHFDLKNHRPKSLPCGHTFCLQCLQNPTLERKCATCRKSFTTGPADLADNIYVIRMVETVNLKPASPVEDEAACCPLGPPSFSKDTPVLQAGASSSKGQEELRVQSYTVSKAAHVRSLASLKRLSVRVSRVYISHSANAFSWPDLPLHLEELHIRNAHADHLRCLKRMPRLRSLAVEYYNGAPLTLDPVKPCGRCGVKWLGVKMHADQYRTLLSLVRAHAASLRTLEIKCGPQDFPALSQDLPASGLRFLRRLVLVREHGLGGTNACDRQRLDIQNGLPKVQVMCSKCTAADLCTKW